MIIICSAPGRNREPRVLLSTNQRENFPRQAEETVKEQQFLDKGSPQDSHTDRKSVSKGITHTQRHAGKAEAPEPILPAGGRLLTPCFTVLAACAAFFFASYGVRMSIMAMKYTSFLGAPSEARELLAHPEL